YPFLSVVEARVFLRDRRGQRRRSADPSITNECCHNTQGVYMGGICRVLSGKQTPQEICIK
ncbi:hypothetical protein L9F63_026862, partial [Diploptera punctata]